MLCAGRAVQPKRPRGRSRCWVPTPQHLSPPGACGNGRCCSEPGCGGTCRALPALLGTAAASRGEMGFRPLLHSSAAFPPAELSLPEGSSVCLAPAALTQLLPPSPGCFLSRGLLGGLHPSENSQVSPGAAEEPDAQQSQASSNVCSEPAASPRTEHPPGDGTELVRAQPCLLCRNGALVSLGTTRSEAQEHGANPGAPGGIFSLALPAPGLRAGVKAPLCLGAAPVSAPLSAVQETPINRRRFGDGPKK